MEELDLGFNRSQNLLYRQLEEIKRDIDTKKAELVKAMLSKKGYGHLVNFAEKCRFPKVNVSVCGEWEYYFADNGSKQGDFIIAIRVVNTDPVYELSVCTATASCEYRLEWQDTNFEAVML